MTYFYFTPSNAYVVQLRVKVYVKYMRIESVRMNIDFKNIEMRKNMLRKKTCEF